MVKNLYKVPKKKWNRWDEKARDMFNELFEVMSSNQDIFLHPKDTATEDEYWKTTAWNASWLAANKVMGRPI